MKKYLFLTRFLPLMCFLLLIVACADSPEEDKSNNANLSSLTPSFGMFTPAFQPNTLNYIDKTGLAATSMTVTPTAEHEKAIISVNDSPLISGKKSKEIPLKVGTTTISIKVTAEDRASTKLYTLLMTKENQNASVTASNPTLNDEFGKAIAISGNILVVGARYEGEALQGVGHDGSADNNGSLHSGAVYIFVRSESGWSRQAYLKASDSSNGYLFGSSVAISDNTIVVGAPGKGGGSAYVFLRNTRTGDWTQQAKIKAHNHGTDDTFGMSVGIWGDIVVVGAPLEDSSADTINGENNNGTLDSGAAYVFVRNSSGEWNQRAYLKASNNHKQLRFGDSVAVYDNTIAVGASGENSDSSGQGTITTNSGAVYVFIRDSSGEWSQQAKLKASNAGAMDQLGGSVAIYEGTIVAGAIEEDGSADGVNGPYNEGFPNAGAAYVFARNATVWSQQAYLKASASSNGDYFGRSVAIFGDTIIVGADKEDSTAIGVNGDDTVDSTGDSEDSGAAYTYTRTGNKWSKADYLKASNNGKRFWFGMSVAVSVDTFAVGASREIVLGSAYLF